MNPRTSKNLHRAVLIAALAVTLVAPYCLAGAPAGLNGIKAKVEEVRDLFTAVAVIIVAIGAVWSGIKFVKGDPDSWGYVWKFGLGAIIVFTAPDIVSWLSS